MMEKGLFKPPERNFSKEAEPIISEPGDGVGTVEDVTDEYHKERQKVDVSQVKAINLLLKQ